MSDTIETTPTTEASPAAPVSDFKETGSTTATDLRRQLSDVLQYVWGTDRKIVTITRHNKIVAAIIGSDTYVLLHRLLASVKSLAPKLGMTEDALLEKLANFEPPVAFVDPNQMGVVVEAAEKGETVDLKEVLVPTEVTVSEAVAVGAYLTAKAITE